jgi:hypothetical protein
MEHIQLKEKLINRIVNKIITENSNLHNIIDNVGDDKLFKIIDKFVRYIYGRELTMVEEDHGYLRFFSVGPVSPYHRNLAGRLWMNDNRLANMIKNFFGFNWDESLSLVAFYFSKKYDIKVMDAKPNNDWDNDLDVFDYEQFDNPEYVVDDEDDDW